MTDAVIMDPESTGSTVKKDSRQKDRLNLLFAGLFIFLPFIVGTIVYLTGNESLSDFAFYLPCRKHQETYLWKVDTVPPSYIFGTIPAHPDLVWGAVSKEAKDAFTQSDEVFTELIEAEKEPASYRLEDGRTIKDELPEAVSRELINFLNDKSVELTGSYKEAWNQFSESIQTSKPYQVALNLMSVLRPEKSPKLLTTHLESLALYQWKSVRSLETPSEHYNILEQMPDETVLILIKDAIQRLQNPDSELELEWYFYGHIFRPKKTKGDILSAYVCAKDTDLQSGQVEVVKYIYEDETFQDYDDYWGADFPDLDKDKYPFNKKNQNLARRIGHFLQKKDGKSRFFAVGVDTLLGYNSVIHLLWRDGFKVERVKSSDPLSTLLKKSRYNFPHTFGINK